MITSIIIGTAIGIAIGFVIAAIYIFGKERGRRDVIQKMLKVEEQMTDKELKQKDLDFMIYLEYEIHKGLSPLQAIDKAVSLGMYEDDKDEFVKSIDMHSPLKLHMDKTVKAEE